LKIDGPYGVNEPGKMFYLKRQVEIGEDGVFIAPNGKYIPKLAELLEITKGRGKAVPHHSALTVFDVEITPMEGYLMDKDAKTFRSALGICLYIAQERLDIQQAVRVLSSYMGRPTKTALCQLLFVNFESLVATWCRPRTCRCTIQGQSFSHQL